MLKLALLWIGWCILHSLLITAAMGGWVRKQGGLLQGAYRLLYILFSCISLVPVLCCQYALPQEVIFSWPGIWRIGQGVLLLYAAVMFYGGKQVYDSSYFLGIRQWRIYRGIEEAAPLPFSCEGILRHVRHPWYSGGLAFLWAIGPLTDVTLMVKSILSIYLVLGTLLEERKLLRELGSPYRKYCRQVPMLIPAFSSASDNNSRDSLS